MRLISISARMIFFDSGWNSANSFSIFVSSCADMNGANCWSGYAPRAAPSLGKIAAYRSEFLALETSWGILLSSGAGGLSMGVATRPNSLRGQRKEHMKNALLAVALALGLTTLVHSEARANGGAGFGIGISFDFSHWKRPCGPYGPGGGHCSHGGCLPPIGWSPYYAPPMMWGGLAGYYPYGFYPPVYGYPYGGYGGAPGFDPSGVPLAGQHPGAAGGGVGLGSGSDASSGAGGGAKSGGSSSGAGGSSSTGSTKSPGSK